MTYTIYMQIILPKTKYSCGKIIRSTASHQRIRLNAIKIVSNQDVFQQMTYT